MSKAMIVGGGIGGLTAAVALGRAGVEVAVFERAPELKEIGAGISLWANATRALGELGLYDEVRAAGADGIYSSVRAQLFGRRPPRYAGYTAWRGVAEAGEG